MLVLILIMVIRRELGLHAQTLVKVLTRGAQADARSATQVVGRGGQPVFRGSYWSHIFYRGALAVAHCAVPCAWQELNCEAEAAARGAARCGSNVLDRGDQAVA